MATQRGDRVFISLIILFIIHLVWITAFQEVTAWGAMAVSAPIVFSIMQWG
jgi:predicted small integral membrane protein